MHQHWAICFKTAKLTAKCYCRALAEASAVSMFLYDLGNSTILTREEEGRLSEIYQKGTSLETVTASLGQELQREPTPAELADALSGSLQGFTEQQLHQACFSASLSSSKHIKLLHTNAAVSRLWLHHSACLAFCFLSQLCACLKLCLLLSRNTFVHASVLTCIDLSYSLLCPCVT